MIILRRRLMGWIEYPAEQDDRLLKEAAEPIFNFLKSIRELGFEVALGLDDAEVARETKKRKYPPA